MEFDIKNSDYMNREFPPGTRLACDVNIANKVVGMYARAGCIIVYVAKENEPDEVWVEKAYRLGAQVIIGQDADLGILIDKNNYDGMRWEFHP